MKNPLTHSAGAFRRLLLAVVLALAGVLGLSATGTAQAQEWTKEEKWTAAAAIGFTVTDYLQTRHIAKNPHKWRELNPMLPDHPSLGDVNRHFLRSALAGVALVHFFPEHRLTILRTVAVFQFGITARNAHLGIRMEF